MREHTLLGYLCATLAAMGDYGRSLEFGVSLVPNAEDVALARDLARRADALGFELLGIQDHPYQRRFVETWMLIADLLARTERLRVFPDVANLPLRFPAMIAKQAATLDVLSGGRFELGLGGGTFWDAIEAMEGRGALRRRPSRRSPRRSRSSAGTGAASARFGSRARITASQASSQAPPLRTRSASGSA
jgi:alkanesulfonate monooxygenase SsuD/methylene tetrahydromethanopterin reductase-like flavin-dependent oxidoreductase (luciferase family)